MRWRERKDTTVSTAQLKLIPQAFAKNMKNHKKAQYQTTCTMDTCTQVILILLNFLDNKQEQKQQIYREGMKNDSGKGGK